MDSRGHESRHSLQPKVGGQSHSREIFMWVFELGLQPCIQGITLIEQHGEEFAEDLYKTVESFEDSEAAKAAGRITQVRVASIHLVFLRVEMIS